MSNQEKKKVRLSVDCTEQERMFIKMIATKNHMTISEYLLSFARKDMPKRHCSKNHEPNVETAKVLKDTDKGKNLIEHETMDEFWNTLGFN